MLILVAEHLSPTLRSPVARSALGTSLNTARFEAIERFIEKLNEDGRSLLAEVLDDAESENPVELANIVERFLLNSITDKRALLAHPTLFVRAPLVHANNGNFTLYATERAVAMLRYNAREYLHHATRSPTMLIVDLRVRVTTSSAVVETLLAECDLLMNSFRSGKGTHFATVTELDWGNGRPLAALTQEHDTLRETLDELAGQVRAARRVLRVDRQYLSTTNPLRNDERTNTLQEYLELDTLFRDRPDDTLATNADDEEGGVSIES